MPEHVRDSATERAVANLGELVQPAVIGREQPPERDATRAPEVGRPTNQAELMMLVLVFGILDHDVAHADHVAPLARANGRLPPGCHLDCVERAFRCAGLDARDDRALPR